MTRRTISDSRILEAIELHKAGITVGEITKRLHVSESGLSKRMLQFDYDILLEKKKQIDADNDSLRDKMLELYPTTGTLEIGIILGVTQTKVQGMITGHVEKRGRGEERRLNKEFQTRRQEEQKLMVCSLCGTEALEHHTGTCGFCRNEETETMSEHDAWLEFESGWCARNLPVNNSPHDSRHLITVQQT